MYRIEHFMKNTLFSSLAILGALLAFLPAVKAQQQQPLTVPDATCKVFFTLSVASSGAQAAAWLPNVTPPPAGSVGTSLVIDNHTTGCYGWTVAYTNHGFGSLSLLLQDAPDNTGGTAPGTWATVAVCGGTECLGINPNTSITSALTATKAIAPWFRMNLTAKSGSGAVVGVLYGYKYNTNATGGGGTPSTCPGGSDTEVQYNNMGACAGTSGLTANATRVFFADGAIGAPAITFGSTNTLGFYKIDANTMGFPDKVIQLVNSGDTTQKFNMNYANFDVYETLAGSFDFSFRDKSTSRVYGILSGVGLTFGPFGSVISGANSAAIVRAGNNLIGIQNSTGQDVNLEFRASLSTGCTFATLSTCGTTNGTELYCSDCTISSGIDNTCAGSGSGAFAERINGAWKCAI